MGLSKSQQARSEKLLEFAAKFRALVEEYGVIVHQNDDGELLVLHPVSDLAQEGGLCFLYPDDLRPESEPEVLLATTNGIDEMIWPEPPPPEPESDPFEARWLEPSGEPGPGGF